MSPIEALDPDSFADLQMQLRRGLQKITTKYTAYVGCIRELLKAKRVLLKDLRSDLLTLSAFNHKENKLLALADHKYELEKATDFNDVFDLLSTHYASFLNYDIFGLILQKYKLYDCNLEDLNYPDHLKAYLERHKISEFIKINPRLKKYEGSSKELTLKMDLETTRNLTHLMNIKAEIANIFDLNSAALQLVDITEGCVLVTFLIPSCIAEVMADPSCHSPKSRKKS